MERSEVTVSPGVWWPGLGLEVGAGLWFPMNLGTLGMRGRISREGLGGKGGFVGSEVRVSFGTGLRLGSSGRFHPSSPPGRRRWRGARSSRSSWRQLNGTGRAWPRSGAGLRSSSTGTGALGGTGGSGGAGGKWGCWEHTAGTGGLEGVGWDLGGLLGVAMGGLGQGGEHCEILEKKQRVGCAWGKKMAIGSQGLWWGTVGYWRTSRSP